MSSGVEWKTTMTTSAKISLFQKKGMVFLKFSSARSRSPSAWYLIAAANTFACVKRLWGDLEIEESSEVVVVEVRAGASQVYSRW